MPSTKDLRKLLLAILADGEEHKCNEIAFMMDQDITTVSHVAAQTRNKVEFVRRGVYRLRKI